jgi:hypothetical protein
MRRRVVAVAVATALAGAAACGGEKASSPRSLARPTVEQVTTGGRLAEMRGHHRVALELVRAGDRATAAAHAGHPIEEVFGAVEGEIREHDAAAADGLRRALEGVTAAVSTGRAGADVEAAVQVAAEAVRRAERAVVGDLADAVSYRGSVVAALLGAAAHEYEEAVEGTAVREAIEYQDAYGFVQVARELYETIEGDVRAADAADAREVEEAFETLARALPGVRPPATVVAVSEVERAASLVGHELAETVDAVLLEAREPGEVVQAIEDVLARALQAYGRGEREEAAELAAKAYLDHYEAIEGDVIRLAPEVNAELEPLLGTELRARIRAGAPVEEIRGLLDRIRALLARARDALAAAS